MSQTQIYSPTKLWLSVQDMFRYWGDEDGNLSQCELAEGPRLNSYILMSPKELMEMVEERLDDIEDALEQLLLQHQVDVYVVMMEESLKKSREASALGSIKHRELEKGGVQ